MNAFRFPVLAAGLISILSAVGCQTSHTETDKPGIFGGHTHEETTTTKNPVTGDVSTSKSETKTN